MPLLACYLLPHPPILVPDIGKGEEQEAKKTIESYRKIAREIAQLKPDTIILSSPHATCYSDCFMLAGARHGHGSFGRFEAPNVVIQKDYDIELTNRIVACAKQKKVPCFDENHDEDFSADHGSLVPFYFIDQAYSTYKIVRIATSGLPYLDHYRLGKAIQKALEGTQEKVVFIGSGDLSHCQNANGPYGFKKVGPLYDERIMETLKNADFLSLLQYDPAFVDDAEVCGHPSLCILAGILDRKDVTATVLSHEAPFGIGYGVVSFLPGKENENRDFGECCQKKEQGKIQEEIKKEDPYVALARESIISYISTGAILCVPKETAPELLSNQAGCFVSIHKFGCLRGCIGTTAPTQISLASEIIQNAVSACSQDPRFDMVLPEELPYLEITVDVLSPFNRIASPKELDPKKYGVIVRRGNQSGLLLPDLEGVDTVEEQIRIAKQKAGIGEEESVELYRFTSIRHR
jgi:MEMO1 family protein